MKKVLGAVVIGAIVLSGCAATVDLQKIKLDSGRVYEVAKTRSGVEFSDCGTQLVSYLFDEKGVLVDSKSERGEALHCPLLGAVIQSGAHVGSAALIANGVQRAAKAAASASNSLEINNVNGQSQTQGQGQGQHQGVYNKVWNGGTVTTGQQGNNGGGNGAGDGTNPGTGHHHDNGDSN